MSAMNPSTPPRNTTSTVKCPGAPRASRNRVSCPKTGNMILFPTLLVGTPTKRPSNEECPGAPSKGPGQLLVGTPTKRPSTGKCPGAPSKVQRKLSPKKPIIPNKLFP